MPPNMAISLVQILSKLVVEKISIEKDFLLVKAIDLLQKVTLQSDQAVFDHPQVQISSLEIVKWMLVILKDRILAAKVSSTLQLQSIELVENLVIKGAFNGNNGVA